MEYGLLGEKLSHSYSPLIHSMLADYRYELLPMPKEEFDAFLNARSFQGMNVTIPYKKDAYAHCDELSTEARLLGNVNTLLVTQEGLLHGHNTDLHGFLSMVSASGIDMRGKRVAILGTGGSGATTRAAAQSLGARETICVSRGGPITYERLHAEYRNIEVIVNATPVGMYPHNGESPVDIGLFPELCGVLDLIYNPYRTALLLDAQDRGIPCRNGLWMLIAQAHRAAELFTAKPIPELRIQEIHEKMRSQTENIILVGMPGSGKSSVGRSVAESMGRNFIDLDTELTRREGLRIPEIFDKYGEAYFRDLESALIAEYGKESALVIATGGGAVLRGANMRALRQNGEIFCLERPVDMLETDGRPLSASREALVEMYEKRRPYYLRYAAKAVSNISTVKEAAQAVVEGFYEAARN